MKRKRVFFAEIGVLILCAHCEYHRKQRILPSRLVGVESSDAMGEDTVQMQWEASQSYQVARTE